MASEILLESGTNELELLEFNIAGNSYGINVAKIKEILPYVQPTPVPNSNPSIEGIFMPRDKVISCVDLAACLNMPPSSNRQSDMIIVTKFNNISVGFHVHQIDGIHRVTWEDIIKPDDTITNDESVATGIIRIDGRLIIILDFEKIIYDISPTTGLKESEVRRVDEQSRAKTRILMAEDSHLLTVQMRDCLTKAGYTNITSKQNGLEAWEYLEMLRRKGNIKDVDIIITDIEMPQMDGHRLTKLVKSDNELKNIPVVIFSSLVTEEMMHKGKSLGVDAQLSKPEIGKLVETIDRLTGNIS